jgi:hypothetical protein
MLRDLGESHLGVVNGCPVFETQWDRKALFREGKVEKELHP